MTRAYINIRPSDSDTYICLYKNGDQYETGVWQYYGFEELLTPKTTAEVRDFFARYYLNKENVLYCGKIEEHPHPIFDSLTDYNWRFDYRNPGQAADQPYLEAEAYNWGKQILRTYGHDGIHHNVRRIRRFFARALAKERRPEPVAY